MELFGILHSHLYSLGSLSEKMNNNAYNQKHLLIFLFFIFFFVKLALIKHIPLINDEAYTLTISRHFSLSYFDHPPLMMWISYSLNFFEAIELYIFRIPHIAFGVLTSFFLYKIASMLYSKEAGTIAAILYFISPFFFFSGGMFIVPDAALNLFVASTTYIAIRLIFKNENNVYLWILLGLLLAVAFLSKYQAYLFGVVLFFAFLVWKRDLVFTKNFKIYLLIYLCGVVTVFLWNMENNFDSFTFHKNRGSFSFDPFHAFNSLIAQFFLLLPTTGILIIMSLVKHKKLNENQDKFLFTALPIIIIFNIFILLSDSSFAHWSMVGWMLLIPMASNYLIFMKSFKLQLIGLKVLCVFLTFSLISALIIHSKTGFITKSYIERVPEWDNTRELLDWGDISNIITKNLPQKELESMATLSWYDSGQLNSAFYYMYSVGVLGPSSNHFKYINSGVGNFKTLIVVRLFHKKKQVDLPRKILNYGYKIKSVQELPVFRGNRKYAIVNILSIEKIN